MDVKRAFLSRFGTKNRDPSTDELSEFRLRRETCRWQDRVQRGIVHLNDILHGPVPKSSEEDRSWTWEIVSPRVTFGKDFFVLDELKMSSLQKPLVVFFGDVLQQRTDFNPCSNFFGDEDWITKSKANFPPMRTRGSAIFTDFLS